jgi:AcrR family transcriptional regulator
VAAHQSPNAVYYYYRNRNELLTDLLVNHVLAINAPVCAAFDATLETAPHQRMTALFAAFLGAVHADPDAHRTLRLNTALLPDAHRSAVVGRYRQILATLREAMEGCVPALAEQPDIAKMLVRIAVGAMSESVNWFRDDGAFDAENLAIVLSAQMLVSARAFAEGTWSAPEPIAPRPAAVAATPTPERAGPRRAGAVGEALWIATETALNRWRLVSAAALSGREVS